MLADQWTAGPQTFVAVGTLGLAFVTFWLVWLTRKLARASTADVEAQFRPALIPQSINYFPGQDGRPFALRVLNDGRGPALDIYGGIQGDELGDRAWSARKTMDAMVIHTGGSADLYFDPTPEAPHIYMANVALTYNDLSGAGHKTTFSIRRTDNELLEFYNVRVTRPTPRNERDPFRVRLMIWHLRNALPRRG